MAQTEVQDTIIGVDSSMSAPLARINQTGMGTTLNPSELNPVSKKRRRSGGRKKNTYSVEKNGQVQKLPEEGCLTSTNDIGILSTLSQSDEGKTISSGIDEVNCCSGTNYAPNKFDICSNANSFLKTKSEVKDGIIGVSSTLSPSFARIEHIDIAATKTSFEDNMMNSKKKRRGSRKKKAKVLEHSGQAKNVPDQGCLTGTNHTNSDGINSFPVKDSFQSLSDENYRVFDNANSSYVAKSEVQSTTLGVDLILRPSLPNVEQMGMETVQYPMEVNVVSQKKSKSRRKRKPKALQNSGLAEKVPGEGHETSNYDMSVMSSPRLSEGRHSEEKLISLGVDQTTSFAVIDSSQILSHENHEVFIGSDSFSMANSEIQQDVILGVDSIAGLPFAGIEKVGTETTQNLVSANPMSKKKTRRRSRKKKSHALQNGGQTQEFLEGSCPSIVNHMNPVTTQIPLDQRTTEEKVSFLGTGENNSFSLINSSQSLSHENSKVFADTNSFPMNKSEMQDSILGVDSTIFPAVARIDQIRMETAQYPVEVNMVINKKRRRSRKKKPNTLHNSGQGQKLAAEGSWINNECTNIMQTIGLLNKQNSGDKVISSAPDENKQVLLALGNEENNCSGISQISLVRALVGHFRKKLLILDLNGLLADIVRPPPKNKKSDINIAGRAIFKRPFYLDFLTFCFERFEVGVWSSRSKKNVVKVVDYLMGDMKHKLLLCWDLSHCTTTRFKTLEEKHKPVVFKELRKIWDKHDPNLPWKKGDYNESNTVLLDDSPYKALLNPLHSAIFPYSYKFRKKSDKSLGAGGDLRVYLEGLAVAENTQKYVKQNPFGQRAITQRSKSWDFYQKVLSSFKSLPTTG
ncbi:hypothetical protein CJ030_MR6G013275 [Morella rubra]|uniref:FCP1 homology domain-containing protein n=1 Tax=Morella rubra TaxID=262757 RepID=A0A6A1VFQ0_9ROSI|nr:hypothetical protein CJ030_MR6G013275 [Morella rubra]